MTDPVACRVGATLLFLIFFTAPAAAGSVDTRPNIILVTVDTFRPDHIGYYGHSRDTSPHLDAFSREGVFFREAFTTSAWTTPGLISILTSLDAPAHGVDVRGRALDPAVVTLPERLAAAGYLVPDIFFLTDLPNFSNLGFGSYPDRDRFIDQDDDILFRWLEREGREDRPHFLYYHYRDLHQPYAPGSRYEQMYVPAAFESAFGIWAGLHRFIARDKMQVVKSQVMLPRGTMDFADRDRPWVEALYDGGIRRMDEEFFGRLYRRLADQAGSRSTLLVVSADHGEELLDHGLIGHVSTFKEGRLYDEIIRIPLIMWYPDVLPAGRVVEEPVQCIDVMPTVLELAGLPAGGREQGRSLLPLIDGASGNSRRPLYFETSAGGYTADSLEYRQRFRAVRTERFKLVYSGPTDSYELFDLQADPLELEDAAARLPEVADSLRGLLRDWSIYSYRRPYLQPSAVRAVDPALPADPLAHGHGAPQILAPADGDTLHYGGAEHSIRPRWTGPRHGAYVIEYEVGKGVYHLEGELEEQSASPTYGPFQADFWNALVLYNPWRFRVYYQGNPEAKSQWVTFHLAPSDAGRAVVTASILLGVGPALDAVGRHAANIALGLALGLVDLGGLVARVSPADASAYLLIAVILAAILWPRLRLLGVERCRRWGLALAYVAVVYCTIPLMPGIWAALSEHSQGSIGYLGILAIVVLGIVVAGGIVRRVGTASWLPYLVLLLVALTYGYLLAVFSRFPAERLHLVEYGFVGFLLYRALSLDLGRGSAYLGAFGLTVAVGIVDELIQLVLPQRFFELKDVQLNALSAGLGLLVVRLGEGGRR